MTGRIRRTFSYANVTSTLALFAVMAGTSYAAVTLAKDSVGSRELKNNAVTGAEVKNGSLTRADFAAGTLLTGPQGAKGERGETGPTGCVDGLVCAGSDLPAGGYAKITIDGYEVVQFPAYRISCATTCSLAIGGAGYASPELNAWFEARDNVAAGTKSFTLTEYTQAGAAVLRLYVENGTPDSLKYQSGRYQMTYATTNIQRVAF